MHILKQQKQERKNFSNSTWPAQLTKYSHWIRPLSVSTPVTRPFWIVTWLTHVRSWIWTPAEDIRMSVCHKASFLSVRLLALNSHAQPKCLFSLGDEFSILDPGILTQNPIICKTALVQFVQVETVKSYSFIFSHVTIWVINRPTALTTYKKSLSYGLHSNSFMQKICSFTWHDWFSYGK